MIRPMFYFHTEPHSRTCIFIPAPFNPPSFVARAEFDMPLAIPSTVCLISLPLVLNRRVDKPMTYRLIVCALSWSARR